MVKCQGKNLSLEKRAEMVALVRNGGLSRAKVAQMYNVSWGAVNNAIKRFDETGTHDDRKRTGRPSATTPGLDRAIKLISLRNRRLTAPEIRSQLTTNDPYPPSVSTVKRRLQSFGLKGCVAQRRPLLSGANIQKRLKWAHKYKHFTFDDWSKVLWTDESKFQMFGSNRKVYVRRRPSEAFLDMCLVPTVKHGGGSVMVWGCFAGSQVGDLIHVDGIMKKEHYHSILVHHAIPSGEQLIGPHFIFQQDNDPKHTSKLCTSYLKRKEQQQRLTIMDWPPQSPDLSPIELLWDQLDRQIRVRHITSIDSLINALNEEWERISPEYLRKLIERMPAVCAAVIRSKGKWFNENL